MEQSSLFGDGVDIDTETPASTDATAPVDARAQAAARAAELRHELDYHAYRYYMLDAPEITDAAFDKMLVELQEIEATYPDLVTPDSYTQRVGGYVSEQFTPVTHMARMYSMDDAMDLDELDEWLQRTEDALGAGSVTYTCELKIDGLGVALTYQNGTFCTCGHTWRWHHGRGRVAQRAHHQGCAHAPVRASACPHGRRPRAHH